MSSHKKSAKLPPLDLSKWRKVPMQLIIIGAVVMAIGLAFSIGYKHDGGRQFAFSYLVAYMFFLSVCAGATFLVLFHHLFDAGWSVPIRRFCEHISSLLFPWMAIFWAPIYFLRYKLYHWMSSNPATDHALKSKLPMFTQHGFLITSLVCFAVWWLLTNRLRYWSIKQDSQDSHHLKSAPGFMQRLLGFNQDSPGVVECTHQLRKFSCAGVFAFAITLTLAVFLWMTALEHEWFSTMYGVFYFAGSTWMTLALVYIITMVLSRQGVLTEVLHEHQFYFIGSLLFAFTVFYAYVTFAQYFIIWNGNMPEETFWYIQREKGTWFWWSMIIIFGHFFVPFLALLRIDVKSKFPFMFALGVWAWVMHYVDMEFNIMPVLHTNGFPWQWMWLDFGCMALIGGVLAKLFLVKFASAAPYPIKDPRLIEAMGHYHPVPTQISGGEVGDADDMPDATQPGH